MILASEVKYLNLVCVLSPTASKLCHKEIDIFLPVNCCFLLNFCVFIGMHMHACGYVCTCVGAGTYVYMCLGGRGQLKIVCLWSHSPCFMR